ncbi:MAG: nicotinate phosphoribosyltransferase [Actinomycetota bacterium]|nr:nicotinate phosphoribosyltransferase [Actinomycetota bacterium]
MTAGGPALFTDLYELTMAASYHIRGLDEIATFDLFFRSLPEQRRFLVSCGLEQCLDYLESLRFGERELSYLSSLDLFDASFLDRLAELRFTGEVWAVPEGEAVFEREPVVRVTAPLIEAQLVETYLLNCLSHQTMVASKAARVALACGDHDFVDFSARRVHGNDAALLGSRASHVAGASATSLVLAGQIFGIPVSGTMAHSYVMRFRREADAFRAFARDLPGRAVLLIDTYDTVEGARRAVEVARELAAEGVGLQAVRLDSGDLGELARQVRSVLDEGGFSDVRIVASGDLDEYRIASLLDHGAPIDSFGVGTKMGASTDAPSLNAVYKLVEDADGPKLKLSPDKVTLPGRKQVHRSRGGAGLESDLIALHDEEVSGGEPLLEKVLGNGARTAPSPSLEDLRRRCRETLALLPERLRGLGPGEFEPLPVKISAGLQDLLSRIGQGHE